jgi:hypothetical protein
LGCQEKKFIGNSSPLGSVTFVGQHSGADEPRLKEGEKRDMVMTTRLATVLLVFVLAVAACLVALVWVNAPRASAQEDDGPANEPSFAIRCDFSHRNNDDPIVHPGVQGAAHSHDFFGNTSTNYLSTYESLRAAGTTCLKPADTASYWIPTVSWNGKVLKPQRAIFYYRGAFHDPKTVQAPPAGLKVVPNTHVRWQCAGDGNVFTTDPPTQCSSGGFRVRVNFPDCSDGRTDSADHRSHMAYSEPQADSTYRRCPQTHPTPVAMLVATIKFRIPTSKGQITLSSDHPGEHGDSMHADFFNAWDQAVLEDLVATCIRGYDPSQPTLPDKCSKV